jgi:hypothetical protein
MRTHPPAAPTFAHRKLPAVLADAEIAHLEGVVSYLFNTQSQDLPKYLVSSYWIARVAAIGERFELVPTQVRRLTLLRTTFVSADESKPEARSRTCRACGQ